MWWNTLHLCALIYAISTAYTKTVDSLSLERLLLYLYIYILISYSYILYLIFLSYTLYSYILYSYSLLLYLISIFCCLIILNELTKYKKTK